MKLIEYNPKTKFNEGESWLATGIVQNANYAANYLARMLDDYKKLQEAYNETTETEPFKKYTIAMVHHRISVWNSNKAEFKKWWESENQGDDYEALKADAEAIDKINQEVKAHNQKVFNAAKNYLIRLGFKETTPITKRGKVVYEEAVWLTDLKKQIPIELRTGKEGIYSLGCMIQTLSQEVYEAKKALEKKATEEAAEQAAKKAARQEVLLIAHTCLKYEINIDEVTTLGELDAKLISMGLIPDSIKREMLLEIQGK